ncbi:MAG: peptidylprolyl isomerase [Acidobacteriota bacterium]
MRVRLSKGPSLFWAALLVMAGIGCSGPVESTAILNREPVTETAQVQHVLVGWSDLAPNYGSGIDARAAGRSRQEADQLARLILKRARSGDDFRALMKEFSEDPGSAQDGRLYSVNPKAGLVQGFKDLGLRLEVGEAGVVETQFGWHIIKRVQ